MLPRLRIIVVLPALVVALAGCKARKAQSAGAMPPVPVSVAAVTQQDVPLEISAVGNVEASAIVQVKSQIAGELMKVQFVEGSDVKRGDLLFEIDPRPYQEALRQAEAAVAKDEAQLRQYEANLGRDVAQSKNAEADAARYEQLFRAGVAPQAQYDQYRTAAEALRESIRADQAAIQSARASVESDRAAVGTAKLNLSYCEIHAPISGRLGNLLVNTGNLVQVNGSNALVVINQITPIFVTFGVPAQHLDAIRQAERARKLPVAASLQSDPSKVERG
ncbi:MAG TPA: biotin/lipoyl-binding protein, partial [Bryobacterales bacterium]|nr:biotin/lipoyl-binding protein [Bryobacterales bacterium]